MDKSEIFDQLRKINGRLSTAQVKAGDEIISKMGVEIMTTLVGLETTSVLLTADKLQKIYPGADKNFVDVINELAPKYGINTKERMAMFLAQVLHESGGFKRLRESLNYSAARLKEVFPTRFKTLAAAQSVVNKGQIAIGDSIYGGRMGNGSNNGDGYKYRGGGLMHTTGKNNYTIVTKQLQDMGTNVDLIAHPDKIVEPRYAVETAMLFWRDNKLNVIADQNDVSKATRVINGGSNGLAERKELYARALKGL